MYDYKTIGSLAAKVVSVLAVAGGVLWWQRTPAPVDIPRPQDEAEIMHACLEREYAMGMTTSMFVKTNAANVSQIIITNVWSNNIGGTWYTDPAHTGTTFNVYSNLTNSAAHTDTNTIGVFPNATFQYPNAIRAAITHLYVSQGAPYSYGYGTKGDSYLYWISTTNDALISSDYSANLDDYPTNYLSTDINWWTNCIALPLAKFISTTNWAITNIVTTSTPWTTNVTWTSQTYTAYTETNTWTSKLFPFERDRTSLYWSTNSYQDMARALSKMQWQLDLDRSVAWDCNSWTYTAKKGTDGTWTETSSFGFDGSGMGVYPASYFNVQGNAGVDVVPGYPYNYGGYWIELTVRTRSFRARIINNQPFGWTNVIVWVWQPAPVENPYNRVYFILPWQLSGPPEITPGVKEYVAANPTNLWPKYTKFFTIPYIAPGETKYTPWMGTLFDGSNLASLSNAMHSYISDQWLRMNSGYPSPPPDQINLTDYPQTYYYLDSKNQNTDWTASQNIGMTNFPFSGNLLPDVWSASASYRLLFQSLTNYTQHGSTR